MQMFSSAHTIRLLAGSANTSGGSMPRNLTSSTMYLPSPICSDSCHATTHNRRGCLNACSTLSSQQLAPFVSQAYSM